MSEFYLVRHGQASFGAANYDKLSPLGQQQSIWLGQYLHQREHQFDTVITGSLVRHKETAEGICQGLERNSAGMIEHRGLNEFDFHNVVSVYLQQYPDQLPSDKSDAKPFFKILRKAMVAWLNNELEGDIKESWSDFEHRILEALDFIREQHHGEKLLVVSSGGAIAMCLKHVLGYGDDMVMNMNMQIINSSVSRFIFSTNSIRLSSFNAVPHLDTKEREASISYA